ncbi:MAG TPA: carboxylate--amine ligase [Candidatus Limiplasma sp.]|nr:carboxylate--amine ligase [Candidatus Limiplasma sp.]
MSKLMLLGGSQCQLTAAKKIKSMGHQVVLADYLAHPPAADVCDAHVRVSTFDAQACIAAARQHQVDGVFTVGSDQPVLTAARVAEALQLPSPISVDTARKATNKQAMKAAFVKYGVPNAPFVFLRREDGARPLQALGTPLVIKPLDSQGQRGVFKVQTAQEAAARLAETLSYSRQDTAVVESFYPSDEVTLSAFMLDGRMHPLTLTDRQLIDDPLHIGICAAHRYPSIHADRTEKIYRIGEQVALALGVAQGPLYVQLLIGDRGVIVNEASARVGGAFEDVFIPWVTGFDLLEAVIRLALGERITSEAFQNPGHRAAGCQVSVQMPFCYPGTVASVTPLSAILALPGVLAAGYNYAAGSVIPVTENATARFGHCVLTTEDGDMEARIRRYYDTLRVPDINGRQMVIPRLWNGKGYGI